MKKRLPFLRRFTALRPVRGSDVPLIVYAAVLAGMAVAWYLRRFHDDLALNLLTELMGVAFIIFIIDTLLVRSRARRWEIVREQVDYLIARTVYRLRDGVATRAFGFTPDLERIPEGGNPLDGVREQRARLLNGLEELETGEISRRLNEPEVFAEESHDYFSRKADEIWNLLNMKYAEYLDPELVSRLIHLHIALRDICGHIRLYHKLERYPDDREYYRGAALSGLAGGLRGLIAILNGLKKAGYSEPARPPLPVGGVHDYSHPPGK